MAEDGSCNYSKVCYFRGTKVDTEKPWKHNNSNNKKTKPRRKSLTKSGRKCRIKKGRKIMAREVREN